MRLKSSGISSRARALSTAAILVATCFAVASITTGCSIPVASTSPSQPAFQAPTISSAVGGPSEVTVKWAPVTDAVSYNLYWAAGTTIDTAASTEITDAVSPLVISGLTNGTTYAFMLTAAKADGETKQSSVLTAVPGAAHYLYVANEGSNNISGYRIASDGSLTELSASPFSAGIGPLLAAATSNGKYLYVSDRGGGLSAYSIQTDGSLNELQGSPFATGIGPRGLAISPDQNHLYVANNGSDSISTFSIDPATGKLSDSGTTIATDNSPEDLAMSPDGAYLYVTNYGALSTSADISAYTVDATTGALTASTSTVFAGAGPYGITVGPGGTSGSYVYVTSGVSAASAKLYAFQIDSGGGLSTSVSGSPYSTAAEPHGVAFSPNGAYLYVADHGASKVSGYTVGQNGVLSDVVLSPFAAGSGPNGIVISPDNAYLYVSNGIANTISGFSIGTNGVLNALDGYPLDAGTTPTGMAIATVTE